MRRRKPEWSWFQGQEDFRKGQNQKILQNALNKLQEKRGSMDWLEKGSRMVGSGIGGFFGGAVGAGVGNLLAGGAFDLLDKTQEEKFDPQDVDWKAGGQSGDFQGSTLRSQINPTLERQNRDANMRHITEPIKAYSTAMTMAELGTPAASSGTGADKIVGWDEMSYFDKATRSGKQMVKEKGGWKEVFKGMGQNLGIGKEEVVDKAKGNLSKTDDVLGVEDVYSAYDEAEPYQDSEQFIPGEAYNKTKPASTAMFGLNEEVANQDFLDSFDSVLDNKPIYTQKETIAMRNNEINKGLQENASKRGWKNFLTESISGDPDQRDKLMNLPVEELERHRQAGTNPIDGSKKGGLIDSILGGLKKDIGIGDTSNEAILENIEIEEELVSGGLDDFSEVIADTSKQEIYDYAGTNKELFNELGIKYDGASGKISEREIRKINMPMPSIKDIDKVKVSDTQIPEHKKNTTDHLNFIKQKFGEFGQGVKDKAYDATDPWKRFQKTDEARMMGNTMHGGGWNPDNLSREDYLKKAYSTNTDFGNMSEGDMFWNFDSKTGQYTPTDRSTHPFDKMKAYNKNFQMPSNEEIQALMDQSGLTREDIERLIMSQYQQ